MEAPQERLIWAAPAEIATRPAGTVGAVVSGTAGTDGGVDGVDGVDGGAVEDVELPPPPPQPSKTKAHPVQTAWLTILFNEYILPPEAQNAGQATNDTACTSYG